MKYYTIIIQDIMHINSFSVIYKDCEDRWKWILILFNEMI